MYVEIKALRRWVLMLSGKIMMLGVVCGGGRRKDCQEQKEFRGLLHSDNNVAEGEGVLPRIPPAAGLSPCSGRCGMEAESPTHASYIF